MTTSGKVVFRDSRGGGPDVFVATPSKQFSLHSQVLRVCSGWFSASMSKTWWAGTEKADGPDHYRYVLNFDKDGISTLLPEHQPGASISAENPPNDEKVEEITEALHSMFRCFYRQPIETHTYDGCSTLLSLADQYDALDPVVQSIQASFFEWPELDVQIKENPKLFLLLGYKLQSVRVFKEDFVHTVGLFVGQQSALRTWTAQRTVPEPVACLVDSECSRLNQLVADTMRSFIVLGTGDGECLASSLAAAGVRDHLAKVVASHNTAEHYGALFRAIASRGFSLGRSFMGLGSNSANISGSITPFFEGMVSEVRRSAAVFTKNNLRIKGEMNHLTCAELSERDLPWLTV